MSYHDEPKIGYRRNPILFEENERKEFIKYAST
jgi:hypothetical protein